MATLGFRYILYGYMEPLGKGMEHLAWESSCCNRCPKASILGLGFTHRPLSSSFLWFIFRIL